MDPNKWTGRDRVFVGKSSKAEVSYRLSEAR